MKKVEGALKNGVRRQRISKPALLFSERNDPKLLGGTCVAFVLHLFITPRGSKKGKVTTALCDHDEKSSDFRNRKAAEKEEWYPIDLKV